jgi:hypothetical protein
MKDELLSNMKSLEELIQYVTDKAIMANTYHGVIEDLQYALLYVKFAQATMKDQTDKEGK